MNFEFCPKCSSKFISQKDQTKLQCTDCKFIFYQNSKPTSSAIIVKENQVLLGRRSVEPSKGMWDIPGGFLEYGEHPEDGVKREALEETGLDVEIQDMLGIFMDRYKHGDYEEATLNIAYIVNVRGGKEKPGDDLEELQWFSVDELPSEIAFENGKQMLNVWKEKLST